MVIDVPKSVKEEGIVFPTPDRQKCVGPWDDLLVSFYVCLHEKSQQEKG